MNKNDILNFDLGFNHNNKFVIHPSVVLSIMDYQSKITSDSTLKGILFGKQNADHFHITNFVLFQLNIENNKIQIDEEYLNEIILVEKNKYNNSALGWFIFSNEINSKIVIIHKHLSDNIIKSNNFMSNGPLLLLFKDTEELNIKGYLKNYNKILKNLFIEFTEVVMEIKFNNNNNCNENIYSINIKTNSTDDNNNIENLIEKINKLLENCSEKFYNENIEIINRFYELNSFLKNKNVQIENEDRTMNNFICSINNLVGKINTEIINSKI